MAKKSVLVVDDPQRTLRPLAQALTAAGYAMRVLADDAALSAFDDSTPELIFISLSGGGGAGVTLTEQIRQRPDGALVPILFVGTGQEMITSVSDALAVGGDYYFQHTLDLEQVTAKVRAYIGVSVDSIGEEEVTRPDLLVSASDNFDELSFSADAGSGHQHTREFEAVQKAETEAKKKWVEEQIKLQIEAENRLTEASPAPQSGIDRAAIEREVAERDTRRRAEEQQRERAEAETKRRLDEERRAAAEQESRRLAVEQQRERAEAETRRRFEEERRVAAEQEARRRADEESRIRAEQELRERAAQEEERRRLDEERRRRLEAEMMAQAEIDAARRADAERKKREQEEQRRREEQDRRRREEETMRQEYERRKREEEEARQEAERRRREAEALRAEQLRREEEARRLEAVRKKAEEEAQRREAELRAQLEIEALRRAEEEAERRRREDELIRVENMRRKTEEEAARKEAELRRLEEEGKRRSEEMTRRLRAEEEAREKLEAELRSKLETEQQRRREAERRAEEEARQKELELRRIEEEARRRADTRAEEMTRQRLEEDARRRADEARRVEEANQRRRREQEEAERRYEADAHQRAEDEARRRSQNLERVRGDVDPSRLDFEQEVSEPSFPAQVDDATLDDRQLRAPSLNDGLLEEHEVAAVLAVVVRDETTGAMRFSRDTFSKTLWFEKGKLVAAQSNEPNDRFEDFLLREYLLTRQQYQACRLRQLESPRQAGAFIVAERFMKPEELFDAIRRHLVDVLHSLFAWEKGHFTYESTLAPADERIVLGVSGERLIVDGVRRRYLLQRSMRHLGPPSSLLIARRQKEFAPERLGLDSRERNLMKLLDGTRSIEDLVFTTGLSEERVYQVLTACEVLGFAQVAVRGLDVDTSNETSNAIDRARITERFELARKADYFSFLGLPARATEFEIERSLAQTRKAFSKDRFAVEVGQDLAFELREIERVLADAEYVLGDAQLRQAYVQHLQRS